MANGKIDLISKGLKGGYNGSVFGGNGETFNNSGTIISAGNQYGGGASYGGSGGKQTNQAYGFLEDPVFLGSGGGEFWGSGANGGGRLTITATKCIVNGSILVNGGNGPGRAGAGSGGSVRIEADTLIGTGSIQANGGNGGTDYGSGGGGRIAIYYNFNMIPPGNIQCYGGSTYSTGAAGTIYLKDNAQPTGDLIVNNGNISSGVYTSM
jgi:hypothetical protein